MAVAVVISLVTAFGLAAICITVKEASLFN